MHTGLKRPFGIQQVLVGSDCRLQPIQSHRGPQRPIATAIDLQVKVTGRKDTVQIRALAPPAIWPKTPAIEPIFIPN